MGEVGPGREGDGRQGRLALLRQEFQRLYGADRYPGTEIGLTICRKIMERHDGRIWVESAQGQGATFYFMIPERQGAAMAETIPAKQLDILIVDDNPADVRLAREALAVAEIPHRLHIAENGEDALQFLLCEGQHASAPRPDLVLLDLRLPRANGFGLLTAIRAHRKLKGLAVVIFTGSSLTYDEALSGMAGADHFMIKPVGLDAYVEAMRRIQALALAA